MTMTTSPSGIAFLERHEGVVLKAYRDPVGIWTIGAGLTRASGVVDPRAGMHLTRAAATELLLKALARNYEPAVRTAMPDAEQHAFDGGVSFHWNTGKIGSASWVRSWTERDWPEVERRLKLWNKAGGRVLKGLERRRGEEFELIRYAFYGAESIAAPEAGLARVVIPLSTGLRKQMHRDFAALGYDMGSQPGGFLDAVVRDFQRDHDLTVDGIVGRATQATLQRMIDARARAPAESGLAATGVAVTGGVEVTDAFDALPMGEMLAVAPALAGALRALWVAWHYRDAIATLIAPKLPGLAAHLRSY